MYREDGRGESESEGRGKKNSRSTAFSHSINLPRNILDRGLMAISCFAEC